MLKNAGIRIAGHLSFAVDLMNISKTEKSTTMNGMLCIDSTDTNLKTNILLSVEYYHKFCIQ